MAKKIPKYESEELIQYVGVKDLSDEERGIVNRLTSDYFDKVKRAFSDLSKLVVHIKSYAGGGKRKKFSMHLRALSPLGIIESCKTHDWDLPRVLHKSFNDVLGQIDHFLRKTESKNSWKKKNRKK
jgi:hypothetical protein